MAEKSEGLRDYWHMGWKQSETEQGPGITNADYGGLLYNFAGYFLLCEGLAPWINMRVATGVVGRLQTA